MAGFGELAQHRMGEMDRRRHQGLGLGAGVAEHHTLVAGALVLVAAGVDTHGDVGRLLVDMNGNFRVLPVETILLIADLLDRLAGDFLHARGIDRLWPAHFATQHDPVGRAQRLDATARIGIGSQKSVDNRIGNKVADLVRMTLGNGFTGEKVAGNRHSQTLLSPVFIIAMDRGLPHLRLDSRAPNEAHLAPFLRGGKRSKSYHERAVAAARPCRNLFILRQGFLPVRTAQTAGPRDRGPATGLKRSPRT